MNSPWQISNKTDPTFKNDRSLYQKIDSLPLGSEWVCETFEVRGDRKDRQGRPQRETLQLWRRDPIECIRELVGNEAFKEKMHFKPERVYEDEDGKSRIFDEMWTGEWWWDTQVCCKRLPVIR